MCPPFAGFIPLPLSVVLRVETNQSEGPLAHSWHQGCTLYPAFLAFHKAAEKDRRRDHSMRDVERGLIVVVLACYRFLTQRRQLEPRHFGCIIFLLNTFYLKMWALFFFIFFFTSLILMLFLFIWGLNSQAQTPYCLVCIVFETIGNLIYVYRWFLLAQRRGIRTQVHTAAEA